MCEWVATGRRDFVVAPGVDGLRRVLLPLCFSQSHIHKAHVINLKSYLICILGLGLYSFVHAQSEYNNFWDWRFYAIHGTPVIYKPVKPVKEIIFFADNHKGKAEKYIKKYDKQERIIDFQRFKFNGKLVEHITLGYQGESDKVNTETLYAGNGKIRKINTYDRNENGMPLLQESRNRKGSLTLKSTWVYNADNKVSKSVRYKRGGVKVRNTWHYEYNESGEKLYSSLSNAKGKIKYEWTFDCDEEGVKREKVKDLTQTCHWSEDQGKFLIKVYQTIDEKGRIWKYVLSYTLADTILLERKVYNSKEELTSRQLYDESNKMVVLSEDYSDGELISSWIQEFKGDLILKIVRTFKDGQSDRWEYIYGPDDLLVGQRFINKSDKIERSIRLEYAF